MCGRPVCLIESLTATSTKDLGRGCGVLVKDSCKDLRDHLPFFSYKLMLLKVFHYLPKGLICEPLEDLASGVPVALRSVLDLCLEMH